MGIFSVQNQSGVKYPVTALDLLYNEHLSKQDQIRIDTQEWLYDYYIGDKNKVYYWLEQALERVFGQELVKSNEWIYDYINLTQKIIDRQAVVYKQPAHRYFPSENDKDEKPLEEYLTRILIDDINSIDKIAHRYAKLFNTSLTQVFFNKQTGKIDFRIEPSHKFKVKYDESLRLTEVKYLKYFVNERGDEELYEVVWTENSHYKQDTSYRRSPVGRNESMANPYGIIPFAKLTLMKGEDFWGAGQCDVVNVNETVNFLRTYILNDSIILGTGGTLLGVNLDMHSQASESSTGASRVRTGRRNPILVNGLKTTDIPPSLQYISTNPQIEAIQNYIDYLIKNIAVTKGLNPNTIISAVKDTSDTQKIADMQEQLEVRRDDIEPCREYEMQRFEIIKRINNTAAKDPELKSRFNLQIIPEEEKINVDFAEIKVQLSAQEQRAEWDWKLKNNLLSLPEVMMIENPDLTFEEAQEIILKNKELNRTISGQTSRLSELLNNNKGIIQ